MNICIKREGEMSLAHSSNKNTQVIEWEDYKFKPSFNYLAKPGQSGWQVILSPKNQKKKESSDK